MAASDPIAAVQLPERRSRELPLAQIVRDDPYDRLPTATVSRVDTRAVGAISPRVRRRISRQRRY